MAKLTFNNEERLRNAVASICDAVEQKADGNPVADSIKRSFLVAQVRQLANNYADAFTIDHDELVNILAEHSSSEVAATLDADAVTTEVGGAIIPNAARRTWLPFLSWAIGAIASAAAWFVWWCSYEKRPWRDDLDGYEAHWMAIVCISIFTGHLVVSFIHWVLLKWYKELPESDSDIRGFFSGAMTGIIERPFFALAVAYNLGGCIVAMFGWATVRNVVFWGKLYPQPLRGYVALFLAFCSMFVSLVAGILLRQALLSS